MPHRYALPRPFAHARLLLLALLLPIAACDGGGDGDRVVGGVNVTRLFAAPSESERAAVAAEWSTRDVSARDVQTVATFSQTATNPLGGASTTYTVTVVSHAVGGVKHYGAVLVPEGTPATTKLPLIIYAHGGDAGVSVEEGAGLAAVLRPNAVWVVPSFRAETLRYGATRLTSGGPASPWDRDVDDALALVNVALALAPQADAARIGAVGFSRGGAVAMLMAIREPRVRRVLEFFGPTDFYGPYVQEAVEQALGGGTRSLPGFIVLNDRFIQPLKRGELTVEAMRAELLRRSAVEFAGRLPTLQVQHGTADDVVNVSQAERLIAVMKGRPGFTSFLWDGGRHDPTSFPINWLFEAQAFLAPL